MLIRDIMISPAISVSLHTPLADIIQVMDDQRIGFMVVEDQHKPVGVITEGDIVALVAAQMDISAHTAEYLMSSPVFSVAEDANAFYAYDELIERHMRHLVVVNHVGNLTGVVTMSCFIANLGVEHFTDLQNVCDIMHAIQTTVDVQTPALDVIALVHQHKHAMIALLDGKGVGILTSRGITKLYREGRDLERLCMQDIMHDVVAIPRKSFVPEASLLMKEHHTRHLMVEGEKQQFLGLLTISNVAYSMEGKYVEFMRTVMRDMEHDLLTTTGQNRALFERNPNAVFSLDMSGKVVDVNPATILLMGYGSDFFLGKPVNDFFDVQLKEEGNKALAAALQGRAESLHLRLKAGNHRYVHVFMTFVPIQNKGVLKGVYAVTYDITERVLAEQRLLKISQALLQTNEAIAITDSYGVIEFSNPAMEALLHRAEGQLMGDNLNTLLKEKGVLDYAEKVWQQVSEGVPYKGEFNHLGKDDNIITLKVSCSPVHVSGAEHVLYYINILEDVTDIRLFEVQAFQSQKMETIGTLAGGVAHDFNNYLAAVGGTLHLLRSEIEHLPKSLQRIDKLKKRTDKAAALVSELLTYAQQDRVSYALLDLPRLLRETQGLVKVLIPQTIEIFWHIESSVWVQGCATQLQQVLLNFLTNARDGLQSIERPWIRIKLDIYVPDKIWQKKHPNMKDQSYACLTVEDNGSGIPMEHQARIFDPFFTTKIVNEGTGMGLSMVMGAVHGHGGCVDLLSKEGHGSTFHVYLPLQEAMCKSVHENDEAPWILFADDDVDVCDVASEIVESLGFKVHIASNGEEALHLFEANSERYVMAILDVVMPNMSGTKAAQAMRHQKSNFPVLFLTGFDRTAVPTELLAEKNIALLNKPWNIEALCKIVEDFVGGSSAD